jgi:hypothetical protein
VKFEPMTAIVKEPAPTQLFLFDLSLTNQLQYDVKNGIWPLRSDDRYELT